MAQRLPLVCLLILAGVSGWHTFHGQLISLPARAAGATQAAIPVVAAPSQLRDVPIFLTGLGTVRAFNSVVLTSRIDGQIVKVIFAEGQEVHAGDVLVEVDDQPLVASLAQVNAAKLKDDALLANARLDLDRARNLAGKGAGTTQSLDTARAQVAQLEAGIKVDQAAIDAAQVQVNYAKIRSPIDGRAGTRQIDVGNIVRAGSTASIVTINQIHPISVDFDLPADTLQNVRAHMMAGVVPVSALDRNDRPLATGKVAVVDNQVNTATGTVRYKATFENREEALWPGQFVTIRIQLEVRRNALTIPKTAVLRGPGETYAFVIGDSHVVAKRSIQVGFMGQDVAVIEGGLAPGEEVVIDGQYRIESGTLVAIVPQAS